jgi:hypothetical protein
VPSKGRRVKRTPCPHCRKVTLTVQGRCAQCWGEKTNRPFPWRRGQPSGGSDEGDLIDDFILWGCCWWPTGATFLVVGIALVLLFR